MEEMTNCIDSLERGFDRRFSEIQQTLEKNKQEINHIIVEHGRQLSALHRQIALLQGNGSGDEAMSSLSIPETENVSTGVNKGYKEEEFDHHIALHDLNSSSVEKSECMYITQSFFNFQST